MSNLAGIELYAAIAVIVLGLYYFFLHKTGIFKSTVPATTTVPSRAIERILPIMGPENIAQPRMILPPPIEAPEINWEDMEYQTPDDTNILLQEAEKVVERIQDTLNHIASNPPDHSEVTSKIRAVVLPYQIFLETEYYDSINVYISLAVERDCEIKLSPDDLRALWN